MQYDFDKPLNRLNTASMKWDGPQKQFSDKGILPLGLADMDFISPVPVTEAIIRRAEHGSFGYTLRQEPYYAAIAGWMDRMYGWRIKPEWITHGEGVVNSVSFLIHMLTKPGDKIILQSPSFGPLRQVITANGCEVVFNPLKLADGRYTMDLVDLEAKMDSGVKLMLLCSPHNPVGRVWTSEELKALGEICLAHGVPVISDEVHSGIIFPGHRHTPFAAISEEFAQNTMVCTSPSKAFNLAGLNTSITVIANPAWLEAYKGVLAKFYLNFGANLFGTVAAESAYRDGDQWLHQLTMYLQANLEFMEEFIAEHIPGIKVIRPEGTYLAWLDCRGLGLDGKALGQFLLEQARVQLVQGYTFGPEGEGFVRFNFGCSRFILEEGLNRIAGAVARL